MRASLVPRRVSSSALSTLGLIMVMLLMTAGPASAATAPNDDKAGALVLADPLPASVTQDITTGTIGPDDEEVLDPALGSCIGMNRSSLWYTYEPERSRDVVIQVRAAFEGCSAVYVEGADGTLYQVSGWGGSGAGGGVRIDAVAGTTYYIVVVYSPMTDPDTADTTVTVAVLEQPPPADVSITFDKVATYDPATNTARVSGTMSCSDDVDAMLIIGGRQRVEGEWQFLWGFSDEMWTRCTNDVTRWTATVEQVRRPGATTLVAQLSYCWENGVCDLTSGEWAKVILRPAQATAQGGRY